MMPEQWKKLEARFHEALELQGEAQAAQLAKVCNDEEQLREEVERLIAAVPCLHFIGLPLSIRLASPTIASSCALSAGSTLRH
jgi:hypothetical protein